jgi:hypothetical protein
VASALIAGGGLEAADGVPLVEAREDNGRRLLGALAGLLDVDEPRQQVQPRLAFPDPLPEVRGGVAVGVLRVARTELATLVERQKAGVLAGQPGRHGHALRVDSEVDHGAGQRAVLGVAVGAILRHGVLDALPGERVLELGGGDRDAVD